MIAARPSPEPGGRAVTGRLVLVALLGFFGAIIGVNAVMIYLALATFGGTQTQSAYKAGLAFTSEARAAKAQAERGWAVDETLSRAQDGSLELRIAPRDEAGRPLTGLSVSMLFRHPADARRDRPVELSEEGAGLYRGSLRLSPGQWDLMLDVKRDGVRLFRSQNRVVVK
jgi:nitrogen fixation protein FixH